LPGSKKAKPGRATPKRPRRLRLAVIPEPEPGTRSVLIYTGEGTVIMNGPGNLVMECGNCGVPLVKGVKTNQLRNLVFKCPNCGAFNETIA